MNKIQFRMMDSSEGLFGGIRPPTKHSHICWELHNRETIDDERYFPDRNIVHKGQEHSFDQAFFPIRKKPDTQPAMLIQTLVPYFCLLAHERFWWLAKRSKNACTVASLPSHLPQSAFKWRIHGHQDSPFQEMHSGYSTSSSNHSRKPG